MNRFAIIVSRFNREIVDKLHAGAIAELARQNVAPEMIDEFHVPGAFELPLLAKRLAESNKYAAVICLGAVIKGDTDHYEYVCRAATDGIMHAGLQTGVPIIFGVLTCQTDEQALARAGGSEGNKGADAAHAAVDMAGLMQQLLM